MDDPTSSHATACDALAAIAEKRMQALATEFGAGFLFDAKAFALEARRPSGFAHYKALPEPARLRYAKHCVDGQPELGRYFLRAAILAAALRTLLLRSATPLPTVLAANQLSHLTRIVAEAEEADVWLSIQNDLFHKEFGLAAERLYAAGSQLLDVNCGIPRSILWSEGFTALIPRLWRFRKMGGFVPFVQLHTHTFNLDKFNESGWDECYRGCVEAYECFPRLKGMFSCSWYFDPVLDDISPRLRYLRTKPLEGGAALYCLQSDAHSIHLATATSSTRRKLFEQGRYLPRSYMLVWSRAEQMAAVNP